MPSASTDPSRRPSRLSAITPIVKHIRVFDLDEETVQDIAATTYLVYPQAFKECYRDAETWAEICRTFLTSFSRVDFQRNEKERRFDANDIAHTEQALQSMFETLQYFYRQWPPIITAWEDRQRGPVPSSWHYLDLCKGDKTVSIPWSYHPVVTHFEEQYGISFQDMLTDSGFDNMDKILEHLRDQYSFSGSTGENALSNAEVIKDTAIWAVKEGLFWDNGNDHDLLRSNWADDKIWSL